MDKVIAHAPAKINLTLEVEPLMPGEKKHRLTSIFCTTTLSDTLVFDFVAGPEPFSAEIVIKGAGLDTSFIKRDNNTLTKAVEQFEQEYGCGFLPSGTLNVELIKSVPTQAGLGGGSSNAAVMLRMLCWLAQVDPLNTRTLSVAQEIGADVPFFLHAPKTGLCAHMGGYGDELLEIVPKPLMPICLVKPQRGISTSKAFAAYDQKVDVFEKKEASLRLAQALKEEKGFREIVALCSNDLEPAAIKLLPDIARAKEELCAYPGVLGATMTGSGSTLFAICESPEHAQKCMQHFAEKGLWTVASLT